MRSYARPGWLFVPLALYVVVTITATVVHAINTPTHTDDSARVRAFTALVAAQDVWPDAYHGLLVMAGPVPAFVPALAARLTGVVDHFQCNYVIVTDLVALILLVVGLNASRGRPEQGWLSAFLVLSLPLFVYHCTSTYADATLAIHLGMGFVFLLEVEATGDLADGSRAMLLLGTAALVKREGDFVTAPIAGMVMVAVLARCRVPKLRIVLAVTACLVPYLLFAITKVSLVHFVDAFPFLQPLVGRAAAALPSAPAGAVAAAVVGREAGVPGLYLYALTQSGNAGMVFYVLPVAIVVGVRTWWPRRVWSLLGLLCLFAEATVIALWVYPKFTRDQTTVHRALLPVSVSAALWLAALIADAVWPQRSVPAEAAVPTTRSFRVS